MPQELASTVFLLTSLYFIFRDNFWRCRAKGKQKIGKKVKPKVDIIFNENPRKTRYRTIQLQELEDRSKIDTFRFEERLKRFENKQLVKQFLNDLYESTEDARQQLYFFLSLDFITEVHWISLVISWKKRKRVGQKNIAKFCHDAYWHAVECNRMGSDGIKQMNFTTVKIEEGSVPFIDFGDSGLRNYTPKIKQMIDEEFKTTWFQNYEMLDLTPVTLHFICLLAVSIPKIDFAVLNPPWEPKLASKIYPKVFRSWRENQIKELVWIGNNHWLSDKCDNKSPGWFREAWAEMDPFMDFIEIKFFRENFEDGVSKTVIKGKGKGFYVVHCKRHET